MNSIILKVLILVLVIVALGGFGIFFYEFYLGTKSGDLDFKGVVPLVTPAVISVGVLIAYLTLSQNVQNKIEESELTRSSFFFNECLLRFDRIDGCLNRQDSPRGGFISGYRPPLSSDDFNNIFQQISVVVELDRSILNEDYMFAYQSRKKDIEEKILKELRLMALEQFVGLSWGEAGLSFEERVKSWNDHIDIDVASDEHISAAKSEVAPESITPFPRGVLKSSLLGILAYFSEGEAKIFQYIHQNKLDVVQEYIDICNEYEYVEGKYVKKPNFYPK
jgi:hypothetical protein